MFGSSVAENDDSFPFKCGRQFLDNLSAVDAIPVRPKDSEKVVVVVAGFPLEFGRDLRFDNEVSSSVSS